MMNIQVYYECSIVRTESDMIRDDRKMIKFQHKDDLHHIRKLSFHFF